MSFDFNVSTYPYGAQADHRVITVLFLGFNFDRENISPASQAPTNSALPAISLVYFDVFDVSYAKAVHRHRYCPFLR